MNNFNDDNNKTNLEKAQKKLYEKNFVQEKTERNTLDNKEYDLGSDWEAEEKPAEEKPYKDFSDFIDEKKKRRIGFFGYTMILAFVFFLASVSYAAFIFWGGGQTISANDVGITISGPVSVGAGENLSLDLIIQNNNPIALKVVDLIVDWPSGTKSSENLIDPVNKVVERIENIQPGTLTRETASASLFGDEGDNKEISVKIEYQVDGSNAIFSKEKKFSIILNAAPARISVSALEEVSSGQEVEFVATITSNSVSEIRNLMVTTSYPFGFNFIDSTIDPTYSNNIWVIESLSPNEKKEIKITGTITGQNDEERVFRFNTGLVSDDNPEEIGVVFNNYIHELVIKKPFLGLNLIINGNSDPVVVANSGDRVRADLVFNNNTNDIIKDLDIRLTFDGVTFDESSVRASDGYYRSADNTLIFNSENFPELEQVSARQEVRTDFSFEIKNLIESGLNITKPEIKIDLKMNGERISNANAEEEIKESSTKIVKLVSDIFVGAYTLRELGSFQNIGTIPPKVDSETTYTINLSASNSSNDLNNARITAILPQYVFWNNKVSPSDEIYSYDDNSRTLVWNIGNMSAGTGVNSDARELSFQVTLFPSVSQIGRKSNLLRNVIFSADDTFTETQIEFQGPIPNTTLTNGSTINRHDVVVE